jgi:CheY-like chemotaxis protein
MKLSKSIIEKNVAADANHSYNILVVEDDDVSYMLLNEILSTYSVQLFRAYDGVEAIEIIQKNRSIYDLILMDIRLPKLNGYHATQKIKEINPTIPIVAVTAYAHSQGIIDCYNSGCDDFIAKPFDINRILKIVEHYLVLRN